MTEDEAKTKWCPFAQSRAVSAPTTDMIDGKQTLAMGCFHLPDGTGVNMMCIGSECMAWRWTNRMSGHNPDDGIGRTQEQADEFTRRNPLKGCCGLAK